MHTASHSAPAVVTRPLRRPHDPDEYLRLTPKGAVVWTTDPTEATAFESMREAMRAAAHLPASLRAFSLPLGSEIELHRQTH